MAVRKVIVMGHPTLRKVAAPIPKEKIKSIEIQSLIKDMIETMFEYDGRGLAAPQINESIRLVVMLWDFDENEEPKIMVLINPELKALSEKTESYWEGCLSVPGLRGQVARPRALSVSALDANGDTVQFKVEGFASTVIQHECDHLDGKLYIDHIKDMRLLAFESEYSKYLVKDPDED